jgi:hypothetical protein
MGIQKTSQISVCQRTTLCALARNEFVEPDSLPSMVARGREYVHIEQCLPTEIPKLVSALLLLGLAWFAGQRLSVHWNLKQKQKEYDLATAREFHVLYGEFFAIWKLWNYFIDDIGQKALPGATRWSLLDRACSAEGKLESTLVRSACERVLASEDIEVLGRFRQLYQQLRESIRDNEPLGWNYQEHPDYLAFKTMAPQVSSLILQRHRAPSHFLIEITSAK